ncbi:MAG: P1 family peptidase [Phototrophicaceae bacterium]
MIRARDLGIPLDGITGTYNAITDVDGVLVGHTTLISDEDVDVAGKKAIRTGVTTIMPRGKTHDPVFAGWYALNGNGEMTGTTWVEESGFLESPIGITNTHSVGTVRDAIIAWEHKNKLYSRLDYENDDAEGTFWSLPVVAETYDGSLNDINGQHVKSEHVFSALDNAKGGRVAEGNVGGGTGMICHEFKGGIGTASRKLDDKHGAYTVGVLVQSNYGLRRQLTIAGVPVGREISDLLPTRRLNIDMGSIIVIVATDAPLLPHQLKRIARRVPIGIGRLGGIGGNSSGDIFLAFSTANSGAAARKGLRDVQMIPNDEITPLFSATVQATEEAILNALVSAETMTGRNGYTVHRLPHDRVQDVLKKYNRLSNN